MMLMNIHAVVSHECHVIPSEPLTCREVVALLLQVHACHLISTSKGGLHQ